MLKHLYDIFEKELEPYQVIKEKYEIQELLGKGSYGMTYLVKNLENNKDAVLKQNRKRKRNRGKESFKNEAFMLEKLNHPSIPMLYDFFEWNDSIFLAMEKKQGWTVDHLIFEKGIKFSEIESFVMLKRVLEVVQFIHDKGIVHLDLRTPNILFEDDNVHIIDFGLAKFLNDCNQKNSHDEFKHPTITNDLYELGHFTLFLLYSSFEPGPNAKKKDSWLNELTLSLEAKNILKRLLQLSKPYKTANEVVHDIERFLVNGGNG